MGIRVTNIYDYIDEWELDDTRRADLKSHVTDILGEEASDADQEHEPEKEA